MKNSVETLIQTGTPTDAIIALVALCVLLVASIKIIRMIVAAIYASPLLVAFIGLSVAIGGFAHAATSIDYEIGLIFTCLGLGIVFIAAGTFNVRSSIKSGA